jgi:hypothetical protein
VRRALGIALAASLWACSGSSAVGEADRQAIEAVLSEYARVMALAYETGDADLVTSVATERERHRLGISISELAAESRALRPVLQRLAIDEIRRCGRRTVCVSTIEVWDLRVVALVSEQTVSESLAQENRLSYTLIPEDGAWLVLSRTLRASTENQ